MTGDDCLEFVILLILFFVILFVIYSNKKIDITKYIISDERIPDEFDGFRIVNVSDFHNRFFGKDSSYLLSAIKKSLPDIIVITGDIIDRRNLNIERSVGFVSEAVKIAPIYYVTGNHEAAMDNFEHLIDGIVASGAEYMDNRVVCINRGNSCIELMGIKDSALGVGLQESKLSEICFDDLNSLSTNSVNYKILLAHRPEFFDIYASNADMVFCGHAHGGQFRIPFIGGLFAPGQGLFPKLTSGRHTKSGTDMIISRGIGNSSFPVRINNHPELVVVELKR